MSAQQTGDRQKGGNRGGNKGGKKGQNPFAKDPVQKEIDNIVAQRKALGDEFVSDVMQLFEFVILIAYVGFKKQPSEGVDC